MIDNLLEQGLGWLGYLERPAVLQQLLATLLALLASKRLPLGHWRLPLPCIVSFP
jgi:hypothetical protein